MAMQNFETHSPETRSADLIADNIAKLKSLFPELLTEGTNGAEINVDVLKQLVGNVAADGEEKYGLNWHGKRRARQIPDGQFKFLHLWASKFPHPVMQDVVDF
jgi:adenine-specific DNA-methyltransferase